jgi:HEAT repeat protein
MKTTPLSSGLEDLIARMTLQESVTNSEDSISGHAYIEAARLDDLFLATELDQLLSLKPDKRKRAAAYFAIGKIGKNTGSVECTKILLAHLAQEHDKYALATLLNTLADLPKPGSIDLSPVLSLIEDSRWLVRHAAIRALAHSNSQQAEIRLLEHASRSDDPYDLTYINETLASIGTERSIPYLSNASRNRKQDVASSALTVLSKLAGATQLQLFIEILQKGAFNVKRSAMAAILKYGDESAIPAVLERIRTILNRKRTVIELPESELIIGLSFLQQFRKTDERVARLFASTIPSKAEYLIGEEPAVIQKLMRDDSIQP